MGIDVVEENVRQLLERGDSSAAATAAIRGYGPQILSYLRSVLHDEDLAAEAFSRFGEDLWKGIRGFRGEASLRTWAYRVAWGTVRRVRRDPYRRRARRLATSEAAKLVDSVRESSVPRHGTDDPVARLRQSLETDEQTLLILRVDRGLTWCDVARVFSLDHEPVDEAALRKRYERVKTKLRRLAESAGLL